MTSLVASSESFPKSARLLTKKDFKFLSYRRVPSADFLMIAGREGTGRLGISISKKILRNATARNRVRRLIKEACRLNRSFFGSTDLHVIGIEPLSGSWQKLSIQAVQSQLLRAVQQ